MKGKFFILNNGSVKKQPVVNNIHIGGCNAETSLNLVKCLVRGDFDGFVRRLILQFIALYIKFDSAIAIEFLCF